MQRAIIVYQSKYGATRKYAKWLSEMLGCDIVQRQKCNINSLQGYDTIIYGGGIYATGIAGISLLKKHYEQIKSKRIIVFAVGASPYEKEAFEEIRKRNIPEMSEVHMFYCRGAFDESIMTVGDRMMVGMLKRMVSKKDPTEYEMWEKALMDALGQKEDWTSRENLLPIVEFVKDDV